MDAQSNPSVSPSILCDEVGCQELAAWIIRYRLIDDVYDYEETVISYACDSHVGDACSPDDTNLVAALGRS